jgi:hypothetical protein
MDESRALKGFDPIILILGEIFKLHLMEMLMEVIH